MPLNGKVLLVDDEPDLRKAVSLLLTGIDLVQVDSGEQALSAIEREHPKVILLDVSLPGISGIEVLKAARAIDPSVPVIMLTAAGDLELARRALELGADEYVTKPFDTDFLRDEVERLLESGQGEDDQRPWRVQ